MLDLKLLGGAVLRGEEGALGGPAGHRHSLALLALLACAPDRTASRGKLVGLLWPESSEKAARNRLSTCLHRLRSGLGDDVVQSITSGLRLNEARIRCDVCRFRKAEASGDWAEAVSHYSGPFLDGFWLRGSPDFERWAERERDQLERSYREALEALAEASLAKGSPESAARWWRGLLELDPFDSRVTLRLMEALAAAGNRAEAIRTAKDHATLLADELGAEPRAEVLRLSEKLRADETSAATGPRMPSVAVLPFEDLGSGETASVFAQGLHHDLLTRLSKVRALRVISRTSVMRFQGATTPLPEIARILGVGTVVEGGVQHIGGRIRLNVQLIDARTDAHQWAETYDRELTTENLFEIQGELAERIAASLRTHLTPKDRERIMEGPPTRSLEAYRLQAEGRVRLDERTESGMRRAVELFRAALEEDPGYSPAWVGLADGLVLLYEYGHDSPRSAGTVPILEEAERAARRALSLDPDLAAAHASMGLLHEARHEGPSAIRRHTRAVELQPGYAEAHNWLSWTWQLLGRADEALASARRAVETNPLSPEAVSNLSIGLLANGRHEEALHEASRARGLQPDWNTTLFYEALPLLHLGRLSEAEERLRGLSVPWAGSGPEITLALVRAAAGDRAEAERFLARFEEASDRFGCAMVQAALGDPERAFEVLETIEWWDYWPTLAMHHYYRHTLAPMREDPRFGTLLQAIRRQWGLNPDGSFPPEG